MGRSLTESFKQLKTKIQEPGFSCAIEKLQLEDGSNLSLYVKHSNKTVNVTICFADPESYPNTGAMLFCEHEQKQDELGKLSESCFQDRAPLEAVVTKVRCRSGTPGFATGVGDWV